jgi:hypothetical protein
MKLVFLSYLLYQRCLSIICLYAFLVSLILDRILKVFVVVVVVVGFFFVACLLACLNDKCPGDVRIELCHMLSFGRFNRQ